MGKRRNIVMKIRQNEFSGCQKRTPFLCITKRSVWYGLLIALVLLVIIKFSTISYVTGMVADQISLVVKSTDIDVLAGDETINSTIQNQLALVPSVMEFGNQMGFPETEAYSTYIPLDRDVFLYSLSASRREAFEDYQWWWPFIGNLPYKGFIEGENALQEQLELQRQGYDTSLGEATAMSTLGLLPDPILTTMMNETDATVLVNTIYHERTHQLFYKKNEVVFNENSAVLLGSLATLAFVKEQFGEHSAEYQRQVDRIHDLLLFSEFMDGFYQELDQLYSSAISSDEKIKKREEIFQKHIQEFQPVKEKLVKSFKKFDQEEINNAYLLSLYRYYGRLHQYYQVHEKLDGDVQATIRFFNETAHSPDDPELIIGRFLEQ